MGSPDGSILYAVGLERSLAASESATILPTGIWAFDAASMAVVGHWPPLATYTSIGETADGSFLIAIGTALPDEAAEFGSEGTELAYLGRSDGSPVLLVRHVDTSLGWPPELEPPAAHIEDTDYPLRPESDETPAAYGQSPDPMLPA